jgi:hypothetical protein
MEPITRTMKLNRITKNAARFEEVLENGEPEVVGNIYLKKWVLGSALDGIKPLDDKGNVESDISISLTVGPDAD